MKWKVAAYIGVSNTVFSLCVLDYAFTFPDFFSQMNALANSSLFTIVCANTLVANLLLVWITLTSIFFGSLSLEEVSSLRQNVLLYVAEFAVGLVYQEQRVFHPPSIVMVGGCVMGYLWSHICEARLEMLASMQSSIGRLFRVARLALFVSVTCEVLTVTLTHLWNAQGDVHTGRHTFFSTLFLDFSLLLLSFLEYTIRLASQECSRVVQVGGITRWELVYVRRVFRLVESFLFILLVARTIWNGSQPPILLLRRVIVHISTLIYTPLDLYKFYKVSLRLRSTPQVTQEELDAEEVVCTICYEQITSPSGTRRLYCSHAFHESCLRQWLEEHTTCPYCRNDLLHRPENPVADDQRGVQEPQTTPETDVEEAVSHAEPEEQEMEGEIQMAYLEYLQSASLLQQVHLHSSPGSPIFNFIPVESRRVSEQESTTSVTHLSVPFHPVGDCTQAKIAETARREEQGTDTVNTVAEQEHPVSTPSPIAGVSLQNTSNGGIEEHEAKEEYEAAVREAKALLERRLQAIRSVASPSLSPVANREAR